uniref:B box-type domain-containing protein n=2 Tax=Davidia involucrata TaxID=16924 RepID=A0A5B7AWS9_DAVIN
MKECELCSYPARMYCKADGASLCWDCDEKVHCANFLVAKHSRSLLCHVCQSPTSWTASGPKLGHTASLCETCFNSCKGIQERGPEGGDEESHTGNYDEHENKDHHDLEVDIVDDDEDADQNVDDRENQLVPWAFSSSSSSSEVSSSRFSTCGRGVSSLKRMRENADLDSEN